MCLSLRELLFLISDHLATLLPPRAPSEFRAAPFPLSFPMAPGGVVPLDFDHHNSSPRPLKRARKESNAASKDQPSEFAESHSFTPQPAVEHIFIADGVAAKKTGTKKVRFASLLIEAQVVVLNPGIRAFRHPYHVVNVDGK